MALSILKQKINKREYTKFEQFVRDCALVRCPYISHWIMLIARRLHIMRKLITDPSHKPTVMRLLLR
jgi:hypothetical protein